MDFRASVTRLAAEVRQILLATTMDVEQRWPWLDAEDRVDAISDLVSLVLAYQRAFTETADLNDAPAWELGKPAADTLSLTDNALRDLTKALSDSTNLSDALSVAMTFFRDFADVAVLEDTFSTLTQFVRSFEDSPVPWDAAAIETGKPLTDTASTADAAARDFATQVQELVTQAETFAKTFRPTVADSATATDATTSSMAMAFLDTGEPYAETNYFADDYVEVGSGPKVTDSFAYILA